MHKKKKKKKSICAPSASAPAPTLAPVKEKSTYSLLFPLWSALVSPVLTASADPHLPPSTPSRSPLKSLAVLWSGATPPLTQGSGPPRVGWAIPESLWCAALCPSVLMVQSPLSKATWELHSSACLTHSGPTENSQHAHCVQCVVLSWNQRGWDAASFNFWRWIKRREVFVMCHTFQKNTNPNEEKAINDAQLSRSSLLKPKWRENNACRTQYPI